MKPHYFSNFPKVVYFCLLISICLWAQDKELEYSKVWDPVVEIKEHELYKKLDSDTSINNPCNGYALSHGTYWYKNFWAKIALLILLLMLIQLGIKLRLRLIRYKNSVLTKKVQEHTIQLNHTIKELRKTKEKLYLQNESQKLLLASISHDIKNPLNFIAYVSKQSYESPSSFTEMQTNFKSIYASSTQLIDLVTTLVSYTKKYNEDYLTLPTVKVNLHRLICTKVSLFKNIADFQKTKINFEISSDIEVDLNREFLSIIIHNLIDNALKNTHFGEITLICHMEDKLLYISITDTGKGMSPETLAYYRNYKYNIDNQDIQGKHSGLGFKIISELLVIMNGEYTIESSLGKGTEITITIKIDQ